GGGGLRTNSVARIGRQRENGRLVGFRDRVIDGPQRDRDGGPAGENGSVTAKPPVIHTIGRGAADRVEHAQIAVGASHASDAEFAGISCGDSGCRRSWIRYLPKRKSPELRSRALYLKRRP